MAVSRRGIAASALVLQPFVALCALLVPVRPPTPAELAAADSLVRALVAAAGPWALPLSGALAGACWLAIGRPQGVDLRRAVARAGAGLLVATVAIVALRLVVGPALPAVVPPEESAAPGLLLGLGAGVLEESVFRLGLLPALLLMLRGRSGAAIAVVVTGLAFALAHDVVPGALAFSARHFLARFLLPGIGMSALCLRPGFAFVVALHCGAHVLLPFVFR